MIFTIESKNRIANINEFYDKLCAEIDYMHNEVLFECLIEGAIDENATKQSIVSKVIEFIKQIGEIIKKAYEEARRRIKEFFQKIKATKNVNKEEVEAAEKKEITELNDVANKSVDDLNDCEKSLKNGEDPVKVADRTSDIGKNAVKKMKNGKKQVKIGSAIFTIDKDENEETFKAYMSQMKGDDKDFFQSMEQYKSTTINK